MASRTQGPEMGRGKVERKLTKGRDEKTGHRRNGEGISNTQDA